MNDLDLNPIALYAQLLRSAGSTQETLEVVTEGCAATLGAKACSARMLDEKRGELVIGASWGMSERYIGKGAVRLDENPVSKAVIEGQDIEIVDIATDERILYRDEMAGEGIVSGIYFPLMMRKRAIGVLNVYFAERHEFTGEDREFGSLLAEMAGTALERERLREEMRSMSEISMKVSSSLALDDVLKAIVESAARTLGFKASTIRLLDEAGSTLVIRAAYGLSEQYVGKGPIELEESPVDADVLRCGSYAVLDSEKDIGSPYLDEVRREGIRTTLCFPLEIKGQAIGVFRVYTVAPYEADEHELSYLTAMAGEAALAIENARLYERLKRDYDDLTRDVWKWYGWGDKDPTI